eukprot:a185943_83.p1 GENE.a185943_83~~a185943_83.p1  ORF type:complete len:205 (-),score=97.55 a185943_83:206-790(-)
MASFAETKAVMDEVGTLFQVDAEDHENVAAIAKTQSETRAFVAERTENMKEIIKNFAAKAKTAEAEAMSMDEVRAEEERVAALERARATVLSDISAQTEQARALESNLAQLQDETLSLQEKQAAVAAEKKDVHPKIRNALSLYANISNISWDFNSDSIKGHVATPSGETVKPFSLNAHKHSMFFITNYLWDMLE